MSEALEEALLHLKEHRERATKAEADVERLMRELGKEAQEKVEVQGALKKEERAHNKTRASLKLAYAKNRDLRKQIAALQDEMKHPEAQPIQIISFVDDCGHSVVINATGTAQKLKVYRGLIKAALKQGAISDNKHYNYTELLKTGTVEELIMAINDSDISTGGWSREGFDPVGVCEEWPKGVELCP